MKDFKDIFSVEKLSDTDLGHLEWVLNSPSYDVVFKPYLENMIKSLSKLWRDPSQQRKDDYPDDYLRGGLTMLEGQLELFERLIQETRIERMNRAKQAEPEGVDKYQQMREEGRVRGSGQVEQPAEPADDTYRPEDDF